MKLILIEKRKEQKEIISFIFKTNDFLKWRAGQYLIVKIDHKADLRGKMRFMSLSSAPFEKNPVITTKIFTNPSSFKKELNSLKIGDQIEAKGPDGDLFIESFKKTYVFIAGGLGVTPFRSILKQLDFEKKKVNITLLYANKNKDFLFDNELKEITKRNTKLKIKYFISPNKINKKSVEQLGLDFKKTMFFISGPENMIYKIQHLLKTLGVKDENMRQDYYTGYLKI